MTNAFSTKLVHVRRSLESNSSHGFLPSHYIFKARVRYASLSVAKDGQWSREQGL